MDNEEELPEEIKEIIQDNKTRHKKKQTFKEAAHATFEQYHEALEELSKND